MLLAPSTALPLELKASMFSITALHTYCALVPRLEFDFVKYGEAQRLRKAVRKRIEKHTGRSVAAIELFHCDELEWAAVST